jgi:PadR family transcriptional regulator
VTAASRKDLSFMNGVPELLILRLLAGREMYGYELVAEIKRATGNAIELGEGCVYPILHSMERQGMVTCRRMEREGRSRLYYGLKPKGKRRLEEVSANWERITRAIGSALSGGGPGATVPTN